jgi:hypothetical protein
VLVNKRIAIHYENMSIALAESLADEGVGTVYQMSFGNGGTAVDPTGIITYLTPNTTGSNSSLYNETYTKVVNDRSTNNTDPTRNKIEVRHVTGTNYTVSVNNGICTSNASSSFSISGPLITPTITGSKSLCINATSQLTGSGIPAASKRTVL